MKILSKFTYFHWGVFVISGNFTKSTEVKHRIENKMHRSLKFSVVRVLVDPYIWKTKCFLHASLWINQGMDIGIDHDTFCAGVVGTAIRHSMSCAGRCVAMPAGTTSAVPDCSTNQDSTDRISGQFLFYQDHNCTKSNGNLHFQCLVPLFVPIGVCVPTHDDGTASDVTIGMWRHNQQATNHEHNGKPWFSFPK